MTAPTYDEARQTALESLERGEAQEAFGKFRWTLEYPGQLGNDLARWQDALTIFARIGTALAGDEFGALVRQAAAQPNDVQTLYNLGYALIEQSLNGIAATVLARANMLFPNQEAILTELACALEHDMRFHEVCRILREATDVLEESFLCRYLLAYNGLMTGDLIEPRSLLPGLDPGEDPSLIFMAGRIREILTRADAVRGVTPLNETDLRGWHFVLTGGILLHLSPFGFEDAMRGRYAYTQDCAARCLEGIRRLAAVMAAWSLWPERVLLLPEEGSVSLGIAAGEILGVPCEAWSENRVAEPGLIVVYDLAALDGDLLQSLREHRSGQILWSHASCWTSEPPFAADLTTYLHQYNVSPWGERLRANPDTQQTEKLPADIRPPQDRATEIVAASLETEALQDLPSLVELSKAARQVTGESSAGAFRTEGTRRRQPVGSPVPSNRFL